MNYATTTVAAAGSMVYSVIVLAISIVVLVGLWKVFEKAGKPGWGAIVPLYNYYCLFELSFGTGWLFLLLFVPCVNVVMIIIMFIKLATAFDKGVAFGIGMVFLPYIFIPMLGFGDAQYVGPSKG